MGCFFFIVAFFVAFFCPLGSFSLDVETIPLIGDVYQKLKPASDSGHQGSQNVRSSSNLRSQRYGRRHSKPQKTKAGFFDGFGNFFKGFFSVGQKKKGRARKKPGYLSRVQSSQNGDVLSSVKGAVRDSVRKKVRDDKRSYSRKKYKERDKVFVRNKVSPTKKGENYIVNEMVNSAKGVYDDILWALSSSQEKI